MASLSLKHIYKVYDGGVKAVNDFCMEIEDKEFIVFVGPSGCGKSTTLRMIAGLEDITAGELMIGDEVVNDVEPKDRNIAMVFQNYALYPHMTVRENMAFALKLRKDLSDEEINDLVEKAAKRLDIAQFLDRKPRALSGGQRQRVSLGRAIVRNPKVFLLDEPLSNLDAKLRAQMRTEISKLHKDLATTFIYVTHDQVEAMTMGTRIVVMKLGVVQQIDTPKNLYDYPGNKFVAGFIGTPQMNFFAVKLRHVGEDKVEVTFGRFDKVIEDVVIEGKEGEAAKTRQVEKWVPTFEGEMRKILVPAENLVKAKSKYLDGETPVVLGIRPEDVHVEADFVDAHAECAMDCKVGIVEALGSESIVYCELDPDHEMTPESGTRIVVKVDPRVTYSVDQPIRVAFDPTRLHLFDMQTELSIMPRVPDVNLLEGTVANGVVTMGDLQFHLPAAINLPNGKFTFVIPSDAFRFDHTKAAEVIEDDDPKYIVPKDPVEAKYQKKAFVGASVPMAHASFDYDDNVFNEKVTVPVKAVETIGKTKLVRLMFGTHSVFAIAPVDTADDVTEIVTDIDWKKVVVLDADNNETPALGLVNVLHGKLLKERTGSKTFNFGLNIAGKIFYSTQYVQQKLFNAAGRKVFDINLDVDFSPYAVRLADDGIVATVNAIRDYGAERFVECAVGEDIVNVYLREGDNVSAGDSVHLTLDITDMGVVEADRGIRVI